MAEKAILGSTARTSCKVKHDGQKTMRPMRNAGKWAANGRAQVGQVTLTYLFVAGASMGRCSSFVEGVSVTLAAGRGIEFYQRCGAWLVAPLALWQRRIAA